MKKNNKLLKVQDVSSPVNFGANKKNGGIPRNEIKLNTKVIYKVLLYFNKRLMVWRLVVYLVYGFVT